MQYRVEDLELYSPGDSNDKLTIRKYFLDGSITDIADIIRSNTTSFIKTINSNFQDCIVSYSDFKNFIRLVDEAYLVQEKIRSNLDE